MRSSFSESKGDRRDPLTAEEDLHYLISKSDRELSEPLLYHLLYPALPQRWRIVDCTRELLELLVLDVNDLELEMTYPSRRRARTHRLIRLQLRSWQQALPEHEACE
jgi:hypothetical protein